MIWDDAEENIFKIDVKCLWNSWFECTNSVKKPKSSDLESEIKWQVSSASRPAWTDCPLKKETSNDPPVEMAFIFF